MAYSKNRRLAEIVSDTSGNISVEGIVVPTQSNSDNDTSAASTAFVHAHVNALVDSAPGTLNTLNELAAALNDQDNFGSTITTAVNAKLPLAGGTLTGGLTVNAGGLTVNSGHVNIDSGLSYQWGDSHERIEQSDGKIEFFTNNGEQMTLSGSSLGIGTASPNSYFSGADNLVVKQASGEGGITLVTADNTTGYLLFADGTSGDAAYRGQVAYTHSSDILSLVSTGTTVLKSGSSRTERMRIDSSGNVMIGKTAANTTAAGHTFFQYGRHGVTVNSTTCQIINRLGNDGTITLFEKDNAAVGTINVLSGRIGIGSGDTGLFFDSTRDCISPFSMTANDGRAGIDLGRTAVKFKDLYLSGAVSATEYDLPSGGMLDWANGDARIVEGLVNNYSLSFQTYDGSNVTTALRLDGNNTAIFAGDVSFGANATGGALIKGVSGNQTDRNTGGYPQYTFVGNEGTGMRRVSSNILAFDAGGAEVVNIQGGKVGIGTASPATIFECYLTSTNGSLHNNTTAAAHFGSQGNADGTIQGISLGYKTNADRTYRKTAIVARGLNDGAARQSLAFLVDTTADSGSAEIGDAKLTIHGTTGYVGIGGNFTPTALCHINGCDNGTAGLTLEGDGNGDVIHLNFKAKANNGTLSYHGISANPGSDQDDNTISLGNGANNGVVVNHKNVVRTLYSETHGGGAYSYDVGGNYLGANGAAFGTHAIFRTPSVSSPSSGAASTQFLTVYSSGHWGEYALAKLRLYTTYFQGGYREYLFRMVAGSCSLEEVTLYGSSTSIGAGPGSITKGSVVDTGTNHSGQDIYKVDLTFTSSSAYYRNYVVAEIMFGSNKYYGSGTSASTLNANTNGGKYHFKTISLGESRGKFTA